MHICFVNMPIEYYSPVCGGAISTIIMSAARELISRGHMVTVLTIINGEETYKIGSVIPIATKGRNDLSFLQRRVSSVRRRLSGWDWPYFEYYLRSVKEKLAGLSPAPNAVVIYNDVVSPYYIKTVLPKAKVAVWLQNECRSHCDMNRTLDNTDVFLTCSDYIRQWTAETHGIPLTRIIAARSGVDATVFKPRLDYLDESVPLRVLFVGRIDPNKGPDIVADAIARLRGEGINVTLTVAGGLWFYGHGNEMRDPYFRLLKEKMDSAGAEYLGHVTRDRLPGVIRGHDVACVLSRSNEPFGLVAVEAMASGCALVASNRGGLPEACGGAGILVDPDDFESVVGALRQLATNPEFLRAQKLKSVERAAKAPWSSTVDEMEKPLVASSLN